MFENTKIAPKIMFGNTIFQQRRAENGVYPPTPNGNATISTIHQSCL